MIHLSNVESDKVESVIRVNIGYFFNSFFILKGPSVMVHNHNLDLPSNNTSQQVRKHMMDLYVCNTRGSTVICDVNLMGTPKDPKQKAASIPVTHPHASEH